MIGWFEPTGNQIDVDISDVGWRLRLYVNDLRELLGPAPEVPDDAFGALAASSSGPAPEKPTDPTLARLLPDGVLDGDNAAAEFRRFSHDTLLERKRADADTVAELLEDPVTTIDQDKARSLLGGLNDLRLMLGTRLAMSEDGPVGGGDDLSAYHAYEILGAVQWELVEVLELVRGGDGRSEPAP
jgi:hypothetical protein